MERIQVADVAQVYELCRAFACALTDGDIERWLSLWIDEGIQMPPGAPRRVGKEQIRAGMKPVFDHPDRQMAIHPDEVWVAGDQAYSHGSCKFMMTPKDAGEPIQGTGKYLTVLHRQIDGSWKIAVDVCNYDEPLG